ncbi:MAG: hypothetical protein Q4D99_08305 [Bacillota bacterium]|nr:hypothetical protein [Bacillota bacterium]
MPNWACGTVEVTGTRMGIKSFLERFITNDEPSTLPGKKFFARSFLGEKRQELMREAEECFRTQDAKEIGTMVIYPDFAWSAYSCLIDGYPQRAPECITLTDACKEDGVTVRIRTAEHGMCFEEDISCNRNGDLSSVCKDLQTVRCKSCGNTQSLASFEDIEEVECYECGECCMEPLKEE